MNRNLIRIGLKVYHRTKHDRYGEGTVVGFRENHHGIVRCKAPSPRPILVEWEKLEKNAALVYCSPGELVKTLPGSGRKTIAAAATVRKSGVPRG